MDDYNILDDEDNDDNEDDKTDDEAVDLDLGGKGNKTIPR